MKEFSPNEKKLLSLIGRRKVLITQLAKEFYGRRRVKYKRNGISQLIARINNKSKRRAITGKGVGCHGKTVWRT